MDGLIALLNSTEYAGLTVKEWSIVQFSKLSPIIGEIAREYKARNISWDSFSSLVDNAGMDMSTQLIEALEPFTRHATEILVVSCRTDVKVLEKINYTDGLILLMLVLKMNMAHLTRFFGSLAAPTNPAATISTAA